MTSSVGIEELLVYKENTETKGLLLYVCIGLTNRYQSLRFVQAQSGRNGQEMAASGESKVRTIQSEINGQCHRFGLKKKKIALAAAIVEAIIKLTAAAQV